MIKERIDSVWIKISLHDSGLFTLFVCPTSQQRYSLENMLSQEEIGFVLRTRILASPFLLSQFLPNGCFAGKQRFCLFVARHFDTSFAVL
jgi:hypothetical protein